MNEQNLKPQNTRTKSEQRAVARKGGKASGKARREKKRIAQLYAEFLEKKHRLETGGVKTGQQLVNDALGKIVARGDSSTVSMIKELREGIDGTNITLEPIEIVFKTIGKKSE